MCPQSNPSIGSFVVAASCALMLSASFVRAQDVAKPGATVASQPETPDPEWFKGAERPGPALTNPRLIKSGKPAYTSEAMAAKVTGEVSLDVRVEVDGTVSNVRVVRSSVPMLNRGSGEGRQEISFNLRSNP